MKLSESQHRAEEPDAVRREFPDSPIVGVGGVVLDGDRVLLVRRGREPLKGEWSLPGGALELGETLEAGVRREVAEETGLDVRVVAIVEVLDKIVLADGEFRGQEEGLFGRHQQQIRFHYVLIDYLCTPIGGILRAGTDAENARWVARPELNSHGIYRLAPAAIAVIEKAFSIDPCRMLS